MVIDSSAILSIYFDEPIADWVSAQLRSADRLLMSTVNLAEVLMRLRDQDHSTADVLQQRLLAERIEFVAPDAAQAVLAAEARLRFPLNFGDCFAYAVAKTQNVPLLTLDRDFRSTDISVILPPEP